MLVVITTKAYLSPHPSMDARSLVYWLGDRNRRQLLGAVDRQVVGTVALRLPDAARSGPTIHEALSQYGLGVTLDGEAWRNQLPVGHPLRDHRWRALGYDATGRSRNPNRRLATPDERHDLVIPYLQAQLAGRATTLISPGHYSREPVGTARRNDLAMAADCAERMGRLGLRRARGTTPRRALLANLTIDSTALNPAVIRWLVGAYTELLADDDGPDGVWVWISNFNTSTVRFDQMRDLGLQLQENTAKPVVVGGLGHLWAAALTNGLAGVCAGPGRSTLNLLPREPKPVDPDSDNKDEIRRRTHVFHGAVIHSFAHSERGRTREAQSFRRFGCRCGHHPENEPPQGEHDRVLHNAWEAMQAARRAASLSPQIATDRLNDRLARVERRREQIGLKPLPPAWRRAAGARERPGQAQGRAL
ncbi:MAG: hypothetical protein ACR2KV_02555 [Solirubrobacteraceae bacterium]